MPTATTRRIAYFPASGVGSPIGQDAYDALPDDDKPAWIAGPMPVEPRRRKCRHGVHLSNACDYCRADAAAAAIAGARSHAAPTGTGRRAVELRAERTQLMDRIRRLEWEFDRHANQADAVLLAVLYRQLANLTVDLAGIDPAVIA